jgi:hypothetical protein
VARLPYSAPVSRRTTSEPPVNFSVVFYAVFAFVVAVPALIGVAFVVLGVRRISKRREMLAVAVPATATVVENQVVSHTEGRVGFRPVVTFHTREGREVKAIVQQEASASYIAGTSLPVLYDPAQPDSVIVPGRPVGAVVAIVFGGIFIGFAVLAGTVAAVMASALKSFS